ncbi:MAG: peptide deformylase [Bradymonadia bacterium]|jgi:peptide deformylase
MAVLEVLTWPDDRLRVIADEVPAVDDAVRAFVGDLFETLADIGGVGLAATQVGKPWRVVIMDCRKRDEEAKARALINPRIIAREGTVVWMEGCLSLPGAYAEVERSAQVTVAYLDEQGVARTLTCAALEAVCVQHELDHLDGQLYIDRLGALEKRATLNEYASVNHLDAARVL